MAFTGFGEHAIDFYDGLEADNSKSYWEDNKHLYATDVRAPMEELLAELSPEFASESSRVTVFRPYRDVRFARDKTPYKTHCGGVIEPGRGAGAYYVEVGPAGLRVGGGCFHLQSDQLARFRAAVASDLFGEALSAIVGRLSRAGWEILGEQLKTRPRGYDAGHPRIGLLRHKSLYAVKVWAPDDGLHEREALRRVRTGFRAVRAFNEWAADHVGVSEVPRR
ncbi:MAG: DUF2461 domain-containing protein [Actinophytocola sp.]|uniref:DUF2461 domain-containing protein n=1 Tax=Actinophytocola sp. TaxID=1872138 RepID=UPI003C7398CF